MVKFITVFSFIVVLNSVVPAEHLPADRNWVYFAAGPIDVKHYYDTSGIMKTRNNTIKVWIRSVYSGKSREIRGIDTWTKLYEIDCTRKIYRNFDSVLVRTDGTVDSNNEPSRWGRIPPHTMFEFLHESLCR